MTALRLRLSAAAAIGAIALALTASPATAASQSATVYSVAETVSVGKTTRDLVVDDSTGRVYVPGSAGTVTWLDTATRAAAAGGFSTPSADPENLALSPDGSKLYVLGYTSGDLTVIDTASGTTTRTITGLPAYAGGLVQDTDTGKLYVLDAGLTPVDPTSGVVGAEVAISTQAYPLLKDAVYNSTNRTIWVAEGRSSVITGYNTVSGKWIDSLAIPVGKFAVDGQPLGGRPSVLAVDERLGHLYAAVAPTLSDKWKNNKLVTIDTASAKYLGAPIEVGDTVRSVAVNSITHELYALNGFSNTLSVITPAAWAVSQTVDFTALGITAGTGSTAANVWAMGVDAKGSEIYITHPYGTARMSVIERTGPAPAIINLPVAPGQDRTDEPAEPTNDPWAGPTAPASTPAPAGAIHVSNPTLRWPFNEYAKAWTREPLGTTTLNGDDFRFTGGTGWVDPTTGAASITWSDGFRFRHYAQLAPDVISTYGNPVLSIDSAGAGTLTFDVSWSVAADTKSDGYKRVTVATFTDAKAVIDNNTLTVEATPEFAGRPYTDANGTVRTSSFPADFINWFDPAMRAWWYTTGASMDGKKTPSAFAASGAVPLPEPPTTEPTTPAPSDEPTTPAPSTTPESPAPTLSAGGTNTFAVGDRIPLHATGLPGNTTYKVVLHSDPITLGRVTTDTTGAFDTTVVIPDDTPAGAHTIQVETADGTAMLVLAITVSENGEVVIDPVPTVGATVNTGGTTTGPAAVPGTGLSTAGALALITIGLITYRRRHQH